MSLGRCIAEWLADTLEGVEFVTAKMVAAREAPRQVIKEMRQHALGVADEMEAALLQMKAGPRTGAPPHVDASAPRAAAQPPSPRPVIRGGKSPGKTLKRPGSKPRAGDLFEGEDRNG